MRFIAMAAVAAMVVLSMTPAVRAMDKELAAYDAAALHVCDRGVTPDMQVKYDVLVASVERAQYGFGRTASPSNFWGPTSPEHMLARCHESAGDGAAGD